MLNKLHILWIIIELCIGTAILTYLIIANANTPVIEYFLNNIVGFFAVIIISTVLAAVLCKNQIREIIKHLTDK